MGEHRKKFLRVAGNEHGGILCQFHDGVFELKLRSFRSENLGGHSHQGPRNNRHHDDTEEFLADAVGSLAMKPLDFEHDLFAAVMVFDSPTAKIQIDNLLFYESFLIEKVGEKNGDGSVGADQPYDPELNTIGSLALLAAEPSEKVVGRSDGDVVFRKSTPNKCLNGRECGRGRAAKDIVASFVVLSQMADELIARVSTVEEQNRIFRNKGQELPSLFSLRYMTARDAPRHGKASEHVVGRRDQTLRIVASALEFKAASRIEFLSEFGRCGKIVFRSVKSNHPHPMPEMGWVTREKAVPQIDRFRQKVSKDRPGNLLSSLRHGAAMYGIGIRPQSTEKGIMEEFARLGINPLTFPAGGDGKNKCYEFRERELAIAGKISGKPLVMLIDFLGDNVQKSWNNTGQLA